MYFRKRLIKSIYFTILYWNKIKYFHFILDIKAFIHTFVFWNIFILFENKNSFRILATQNSLYLCLKNHFDVITTST